MVGANNPLAMSDEDFLKLNDPSQIPGSEAGEANAEEENQEEEEVEEEEDTSTDTESENDGEDNEEEEQSSETEGGDEEATPASGEADEQDVASEEGTPVEKNEEEKEKKPASEQEQTSTPSDLTELQSFYSTVMAPFKANGKTIQAKSPEEVLTLMQMGANYTKKMQDIQPHRKVLMMLEDNGLLDQAKLGYLVDLHKGDKAAITKLLKDTEIDPLDIDTESDSNYLGGNHQISDQQANFREVVQEVAQSDSGKETLQIIDQWDDASKDAVWENPEIIQVMQSQRDNGVYDQIVSELDRQRALGKIPANLPFIQAYKLVGDQLFAPAQSGQSQPAQKVKIAEKVAKPKPKVSNGDKASAAAPSRSTPRKNGQVVNPLAMSDEEFAKMAGIQL